MENEQILTVLAEVLEEQKEMNRVQLEMLDLLRSMTAQSKLVDVGSTNLNNTAAIIDSKAFEQAMESLRNDIKVLVAAHRLNNQQNNLRVFMESDTKKWAVCLVVALVFLTYLYWFSVHK